MIRRRFLALAMAACITMKVDPFDLVALVAPGPPGEGVIEWDREGEGGFTTLSFERPVGFNTLHLTETMRDLDVYHPLPGLRLSDGCHTLNLPTVSPAGIVEYRWTCE